MRFRDLPSPDQFPDLCQAVAHFATDYWHAIFDDPTYRRIALDLAAGSSLVTDLDFTAYFNDAGFTLLEAAVFTGLVPKDRVALYHQLIADYANLSPTRTLEQKTADEFTFYCETLRIFSGLKHAELLDLSRKMWLTGIAGFSEKHPLRDYLYPEMLYLYALAKRGAKDKHHGVVAVTASPNFAIEPALALLSLMPQTLRSMDLTVDAKGFVTPQIPRPVHGAGKIAAAHEVFPSWDYACGDNPRNDRAFMNAAKKSAVGIGGEIRLLQGKEKNLVFLNLPKPPVAS